MVQWSEIVAKCGNYREGFVAIFREYEGNDTDERNGQGRVVKVTPASFARHMGIGDNTFRNWLRDAVEGEGALHDLQSRNRADAAHARGAKVIARRNPSALVDAIESSGASDDVFHELKLRRAGIDTSRAGRKRADAIAHEQTEPIREALARMASRIDLCEAALTEAAEYLREAQEAGEYDDAARAQLRPAYEALVLAYLDPSVSSAEDWR